MLKLCSYDCRSAMSKTGKSSKALFYIIVSLDTGVQGLVIFWQVIQSESHCPKSEGVQLTNSVHYISTLVVLLPERKLLER